MIRMLLAAAALAVLHWLAPHPAFAQGDEQTLVDRSTLALQEMMNQTVSQDPKVMLQRSRAVMICPRVFKAGFILGGEGGACALLARAANGTWSYPAFYGMGSGSFGLQIGIQDSQFIMLIMTEKGLQAILDSQFKLGADASIAIATFGAGIQGSTTGALGADIVAFSQSRGLFGGISIEGSLMGARSEWNRAYYGRDIGTRQIVIEMQATNPGADPLRHPCRSGRRSAANAWLSTAVNGARPVPGPVPVPLAGPAADASASTVVLGGQQSRPVLTDC
jgi:lipid-binding SYLF domain-containing protein